MYEIKEGIAKIKDITIPVYKREVTMCNSLEVVAGTNGYRGGDSGYGSRTYIRIQDTGGTDISVKRISGDKNEGEGVEIVLGGDSELKTIINALKFITKVLEDQTNEVYD